MYLDPVVFHALWAIASLPVLLCFILSVVIARGRSVGGLTFCRVGRLGFSFYISRVAV